MLPPSWGPHAADGPSFFLTTLLQLFCIKGNNCKAKYHSGGIDFKIGGEEDLLPPSAPMPIPAVFTAAASAPRTTGSATAAKRMAAPPRVARPRPVAPSPDPRPVGNPVALRPVPAALRPPGMPAAPRPAAQGIYAVRAPPPPVSLFRPLAAGRGPRTPNTKTKGDS